MVFLFLDSPSPFLYYSTHPKASLFQRKRPFMCIAVLGILFWLFSFQGSEACTLWGATGRSVEGGGTLIAKNRDWVPDNRQELTILKPAERYKSLALKAVGGTEPGIKAGVNEKGLVILSATAEQVAKAERSRFHQKKGLMSYFLATCASVEDILKNLDLMGRPVFYMVGDRKELAAIEIGPDGQHSVMVRDSGTVAHTNHYLTLNAQNLRKPGTSSTQRYARIEGLLKNRKRPFVVEDFVRFSEDRNAGPNNSLWRRGSHPKKTRTLATWLVLIPPSGSPQLYFKTANPGEPEEVCRLSVGDALWADGRNPILMDSDLCKDKSSK
jgi:isopenicillin-N N-acyltransferase-like protein